MRQLKKDLLAIKQRKEESSKPALDEVKEGMCTRDYSIQTFSIFYVYNISVRGVCAAFSANDSYDRQTSDFVN